MRRATPEDAPAVAALCGQLGYPTTAAGLQPRLEDLLARPDHAVFVAQAGSAVVGWVHAFASHVLEAGSMAEVGGLVVADNQRGRGIGRLLIEQVEAWACDQGLPVVYLRSNTVRREAHRFYQRLGYCLIKSQYAFRKEVPTTRSTAGGGQSSSAG
ncbi:MAG: GNAT family N-acetyltransferase [Chloroflexi bacterium]|nr:GNAT family N-acetyltransferase [Chloroflexota bacterium]